jgi:hypothetical protein
VNPRVVDAPKHTGRARDQLSAFRFDDGDQRGYQAGIGGVTERGDETNAGLQGHPTIVAFDDRTNVVDHDVWELGDAHQ